MDKFNLIRDPEYGFMRVDPIPSRHVVEKFYREEFYSSEYVRFNDSARDQTEKDRDFNTMRYEDILDIAESFFGTLSGKSLFDVGCGFGELLKYAKRRGLECGGIEVSQEAIDCTLGLGFKVSLSDIETDFSELGGKRYDIVCALNVLEHLRNPTAMLRAIRANLLTPNGLLVIDVPNEFNLFQNAAVAEHNLNQWWIAPPAHLNYFSADSLKSVVQGCGYRVVDAVASFPLEMFLLMGDVYVGNNELGAICHRKRVAFETVLRRQGKKKELIEFYRCLAGLNLGRQVVCYATPDPFSKPFPAVSREGK
ncbi:conserved hypothetical protein [Rhodospirillaceae bacterium LM-1]|nr:conserved hypothetical protein [Rhodospirillaceae bacterium LM-1]